MGDFVKHPACKQKSQKRVNDLPPLSSFLSDYDSLNEEDVAGNNQLAFDVAEREFGIQPVIRGDEMAAEAEPDKLLMVLYLSKFYEAFRNSGQAPSRFCHRESEQAPSTCSIGCCEALNSVQCYNVKNEG